MSGALAGKRIVVTRPRRQAPALAEALRSLGALVVEAPAIAIEPPADFAPLDEALARIETYDWIVFTSANGVEAFFDRLELVRSRAALSRARFAAIGPATADSLQERGIRADVVPERFVAEDVFRALAEHEELSEKRFLLPRADIAREALPELLRGAGAHVEVVVAYRTVPASGDIAEAAALVARGEVDLVTFTSASTARSFFSVASPAPIANGRVAAASIGPITSRALREMGIEPAIEADRFTVEGLVAAIVRHCEKS